MTYDEFRNGIGKSWSELDGFSPKCAECDFTPFCRGGCQFAASEKNDGKYGFSFCEKPYMGAQLTGFIKNNLYK